MVPSVVPSSMSTGRRLAMAGSRVTRQAARRTVLSGVIVLAIIAGLAGGLSATPSSASPLGTPAAQTAADYLPTAGDVPGGFREQTTIDVGGLLEPGTALRRI